MAKRLPTAIICLCTLLLAVSARADWIAQSNRNSLEVLQGYASFSPEWVSSYGLDNFDTQTMDLGPNVFDRRKTAEQAMLKTLKTRLAQAKDIRVRQDLEILIGAIRDNMQSAEIDREYLLPYYSLHKTLFRSFNNLLDPRTEKSRYPAALERLSKYSGQLPGYRPITELAMARSSERFKQANLLGPYLPELQDDLDNAPLYLEGIHSAFEASGIEGWEQSFALLKQQLESYQQWLLQEMVPRARPDNRLPAPVYANYLREYGVDASPEQLIRDGLYNYQLIREQMQSLARAIAQQRGWDQRDLISVIRAFKQQQIPADDILAIYLKRLADVETIIRQQNLITLPERDAAIRLATKAESAAIPAPFMSPPQMINNSGQYGEFVLVQGKPSSEGTSIMDDFSHEAVTWALVTHEARPGHELQFASMVENGTSLARTIFASNSANSEGWGLYAESVMEQYLPPEGQLFVLYMRMIRAARMFLDPMVNTGQMSPEQVVSFLTGQLAMSQALAQSEADRYAFDAPGQATSYFYGFMNLLRLRAELEIGMDSQFDQRKFHDFVLEQGLLPPEVLRQAVLNQFLAPGS